MCQWGMWCEGVCLIQVMMEGEICLRRLCCGRSGHSVVSWGGGGEGGGQKNGWTEVCQHLQHICGYLYDTEGDVNS